jgi:hypothetical protein
LAVAVSPSIAAGKAKRPGRAADFGLIRFFKPPQNPKAYSLRLFATCVSNYNPFKESETLFLLRFLLFVFGLEFGVDYVISAFPFNLALRRRRGLVGLSFCG